MKFLVISNLSHECFHYKNRLFVKLLFHHYIKIFLENLIVDSLERGPLYEGFFLSFRNVA